MHVETNTTTQNPLAEDVIRLHDIARNIETTFGFNGQLSDTLRQCADTLNELIKPHIRRKS